MGWPALFGLLLACWSCAASAGEVLVYVANEVSAAPAERANLERIAEWLRSSGDEGDRLLAEGLITDLALFPSAVDVDQAALTRLGPSRAGLVIATNRLAQAGQVLVAQHHGALASRPLTLPPPRDGREASSPLSNRVALERVLALAAEVFPPASHEFIVVIESHGDAEYALTPRLGLPTEGLTREALLARVHGADTAFVERYGVTTASLVDLLVELKRTRGFTTKLLVMASCESTLERLVPEVPLALVAAGGAPLEIGVIDYERVLSSPEPDLAKAFVATLTPAPFEVADPSVLPARRRMERLHRALAVAPWFLPLLAWFGVFGWRRWRARKGR
ncbi:MAG: hypothetical protein IAE78_08500 [Myxococcus sp.]|nr:hypothetical protein [Myxococcus sp.]